MNKPMKQIFSKYRKIIPFLNFENFILKIYKFISAGGSTVQSVQASRTRGRRWM